MKEKNRRKQLILSIVAVLLLVLLTIGVTYAVFTYTKLGTTENTITAGTLKFLYTENTGVGAGIALTDALPVPDAVGKTYATDGKVFDFKLEGTNTGTEVIPYEVTLRKKSTSTLPDYAVKVYLTDMTEDLDTQLLPPTLYSQLEETSIDVGEEIEKTIYKDVVPANTDIYLKQFRLRMWVDENVDIMSNMYSEKNFSSTVNVYANTEVVTGSEGSVYTEKLLNGADPVLKSDNTVALSKGINRIESTITDELVPVIIDNTGKVTKADTSKRWYNYSNKEWANAVILKDYSITYEDGAEILESNIESYFVWIPKYSYQLFDLGSYTEEASIGSENQIINIRFGLTNTDDSNDGECTTPGMAGESGSCQVGDYMTHPSFLAFDSNGLWVGKFETGYDGAISTIGAQSDTVNTSKIVIKPNVYSWRNITVGNIFKNGYDYNRSLDSHAMKNTEWAAVAYLQHSAYGSASSVRFNNNSDYITGYSSTTEPILGYNDGISIEGNRNESTGLGIDGTYTVNYLNSASVVASTTGNYTGIYDMSGGTFEYAMGYTTGATQDFSGITSLYSNFFTDSTYTKYWDKYSSTDFTNYDNRILGDATGEIGPFGSQTDPDEWSYIKSSWYRDCAFFAGSYSPWFARGGDWAHGTNAGIFAFYDIDGDMYTNFGFRVVLAP